MIQRGIATFGLDFGKCPPWLFERMVKLGREMTRAIVAEEGADEFIRRLADPAWFQALGTVLAFDWNASGLTTILTAALKEAIRYEEIDLGLFICGGKGKTSRKTPDEILGWGEKLNLNPQSVENLIYNSKMAAKVDSALVQDGFQIYHHTFFFSYRNGACPHTKRALDASHPENTNDTRSGVGAWTVVQQGMNAVNQTARRYHWHSKDVKDLVCEPHSAISSQTKVNNVLDLTAGASAKNRDISTELVATQGFDTLMKDLIILSRHITPLSQVVEIGKVSGTLNSKVPDTFQQKIKLLNLKNREFKTHPVVTENFSKSKYLQKILWRLAENKPENYEKLLATERVGPKTIRALALVAEVLYGAKPSYEDPARYSFAHGGKDGTPYPVDRSTYDKTIETMREYVKKSKIPLIDKQKSLEKLEKNIFPAKSHDPF